MPDLPDATYLTDFHAYRAEHDPDGRCWTYLERTWTWGEAWDDVRRFAGALQAEGIVRGDRIAFLDKNKLADLEVWHDPKMALSSATGAEVLPTTILYDGKGREMWRYVGDLDWTGQEAATLLADAGKPAMR